VFLFSTGLIIFQPSAKTDGALMINALPAVS
jgi:hypothetical protein